MGILSALAGSGITATASGGEGGINPSSGSGDISSPLDINFGKNFAPVAPSSGSTATVAVLGVVIIGLLIAVVKG